MSSRRISTGYAVCLATVLVLAFLSSVPSPAQVSGATLSGTITDSSGGVVPDSRVVITNVATGVTTNVTTNSDGFYTAANLLPGEYNVIISAKGYTTQERTGISLTVGAQQVFDLISLGAAGEDHSQSLFVAKFDGVANLARAIGKDEQGLLTANDRHERFQFQVAIEFRW